MAIWFLCCIQYWMKNHRHHKLYTFVSLLEGFCSNSLLNSDCCHMEKGVVYSNVEITKHLTRFWRSTSMQYSSLQHVVPGKPTELEFNAFKFLFSSLPVIPSAVLSNMIITSGEILGFSASLHVYWLSLSERLKKSWLVPCTEFLPVLLVMVFVGYAKSMLAFEGESCIEFAVSIILYLEKSWNFGAVVTSELWFFSVWTVLSHYSVVFLSKFLFRPYNSSFKKSF